MRNDFRFKAVFPFILILILMGGAYLLIYLYFQTTDSLRQFHFTLKNFHAIHPIATPLIFIITYVIYAVLMLPGIAFLSLFSGFLFPQPLSTLYVIIGALIGSSLLFLAARTAFNEILRRHTGPFLNKLEEGFRSNASNYLLFLRLIPLFPFKVVNLAGAFFDVPFFTFAWTTCIGMIPSVFIYTEAGKELSVHLDQANPLDPWNFFDYHLILILIALALLALLPIFIKSKR